MELALNNITKKYKETLAVDSFTTSITPGIYGLLGANGAGKTTLISLICDTLKPTSGYICYNSIPLKELDADYRKILGYLPQHFGYYPEFTAADFLMYMAYLKGIPMAVATNRINELLKSVRLFNEKNRKIKTFSGGMKQRLGIAQALLNDPEILILDEPTAGLDPKERVHFKNIISSFSRDKIVLLSTHIVSDVSSIANEILIMKKGKLIQRGTQESLLSVLNGKVWECTVEDHCSNDICNNFNVTNINLIGNMAKIRIVSDECPLINAANSQATLEDLYLYHFEDKEETNV